MPTFSKGQIDRLGDQLRDGKSLSSEDESLIEEVWTWYFDLGEKVSRLLADQGLAPTWRPKTQATTIEKLRRQTIRLSQMEDIAGVRVVGDWSLAEQDVVAERIASLFTGARVKRRDRRQVSQHGYRALHLIPYLDGWPVEIQIRTMAQDQWAQTQEKLADLIGRGIRYGDPPDSSGMESVLEQMETWSQSIQANEEQGARLEDLEQQIYGLDADRDDSSDEVLEMIDQVEGLKAEAIGAQSTVVEELRRLHALLTTVEENR